MSVPGKNGGSFWTPINLSAHTHTSYFFIVAFNDIGKSAKDLLSKDYPVGGVKVEVKTTAANGVVSEKGGED